MTESAYFTTLPNRGLIRVSGPERRAFLQGLISNDVDLLDTQPCVYACLLNAQGKFLHDFFLTEKDGVILIDCEGSARTEDLAKRLKMFKLRSKVEIETQPNHTVYVSNQNIGWSDPRHKDIGYRSFEKPNLPEKPFEEWDRHRIMLTIPDGSRDMIVEQSTLLECNIDKLNGVSFEKGCYVGQELTSRMHHRNLGKKHLQTVNLNALPEGAELRSQRIDIGIALVKK
jgi:tRNA-modifying protein YgfZ